MSDTPRTDALDVEQANLSGWASAYAEMSAHARKLEREVEEYRSALATALGKHLRDKTMSDTPRADALMEKHGEYCVFPCPCKPVADFARQLEREYNNLVRELRKEPNAAPQGSSLGESSPLKPGTTPAVAAPYEDDMCPNCVTPWKCNGPHIG